MAPETPGVQVFAWSHPDFFLYLAARGVAPATDWRARVDAFLWQAVPVGGERRGRPAGRWLRWRPVTALFFRILGGCLASTRTPGSGVEGGPVALLEHLIAAQDRGRRDGRSRAMILLAAAVLNDLPARAWPEVNVARKALCRCVQGIVEGVQSGEVACGEDAWPDRRPYWLGELDHHPAVRAELEALAKRVLANPRAAPPGVDLNRSTWKGLEAGSRGGNRESRTDLDGSPKSSNLPAELPGCPGGHHPETVERLWERVRGANDPNERGTAAVALGRMGHQESEPRLGELLDEQAPDAVLEGAMAALGLLGKAASIPAIRLFIQDWPDQRHFSAIQSRYLPALSTLLRWRDPEWLARVREHARTGSDHRTVGVALRALGCADDLSAFSVLRALLDPEKDPVLRARVVEALVTLIGERALPDFRVMLAEEPFFPATLAVIQELGRLGDRSALPRLRQWATARPATPRRSWWDLGLGEIPRVWDRFAKEQVLHPVLSQAAADGWWV